ncbi:hypothetical protein DAPPUDRAFT_334485 [Daphnia pulex]|uniref:Uncharacterized protein n=1 Tax=Daphnia pulex TaxID=6669 RepID=E9HVN4_DAPPU|nr:hypothetical protein DAPPUDRAFT_334485 [Daphnia pulex]|eukprot:EFX64201.1 hypothetical protein DAPPUDRAFT_334485 [Daphnia pulex]
MEGSELENWRIVENSTNSACVQSNTNNDTEEQQVLKLMNEDGGKQDDKIILKRNVKEDNWIEFSKKAKLGSMNTTYVFDRQYQNIKDGISDVGEGGFESSGSNDYGDDEESEESSLCSSMSHCTTESESEDNEEFL